MKTTRKLSDLSDTEIFERALQCAGVEKKPTKTAVERAFREQFGDSVKSEGYRLSDFTIRDKARILIRSCGAD